MARRRNKIVPETGSRFGRGPHQFRTRNELIEQQQTRSNLDESAGKSTKLIDIPSLITVWLQVRALPGPPLFQWVIDSRFRSPHQNVPLRLPRHALATARLTLHFVPDEAFRSSIEESAGVSRLGCILYRRPVVEIFESRLCEKAVSGTTVRAGPTGSGAP